MPAGVVSFYSGRSVLVTGGLGFLGSNLAVRLSEIGARVTVIDSLVPGCGGSLQNLGEAADAIRVETCDIGDSHRVQPILAGQQTIFNLAGEISHTVSMADPERDLDLNARAHLRFLESCRRVAPEARIVYAGSRQVYGVPRYLPVDENHPIAPVDFNGVHKWAAESYHRLVSSSYGMTTVCLRLTNVYGPRQALDLPQQGFIGTFLRRALQGESIEIYGDGSQIRDMLYAGDAVEAFLRAGAAPLGDGSGHATFNVGGPEALTLRDIARTVAEAAGNGTRPRLVPFPPSRKKIDIGDYRSDDRGFRTWARWAPQVGFEEGIRRTVAFSSQWSGDSLPWAARSLCAI